MKSVFGALSVLCGKIGCRGALVAEGGRGTGCVIKKRNRPFQVKVNMAL